MTKICTSEEQSKKLIELGIDVNTADMLYGWHDERWYCVPKDVPYPYSLKDMIPAWSLTALLDVLDYPQLSKDNLGKKRTGWMVSVYPDNCRYDSCWRDNPVDACVEMIIKLNELKML